MSIDLTNRTVAIRSYFVLSLMEIGVLECAGSLIQTPEGPAMLRRYTCNALVDTGKEKL